MISEGQTEVFFMPLLGTAWGAAVGAISGHFSDYGIGRELRGRWRVRAASPPPLRSISGV
jgi:hypothetical protein